MARNLNTSEFVTDFKDMFSKTLTVFTCFCVTRGRALLQKNLNHSYTRPWVDFHSEILAAMTLYFSCIF